jgi:hypothetical protein
MGVADAHHRPPTSTATWYVVEDSDGRYDPVAVRLQIVATGEIGTVIGSNVGGQYLWRMDSGELRTVDGTERVRIVLPGWSLVPPDDADWHIANDHPRVADANDDTNGM